MPVPVPAPVAVNIVPTSLLAAPIKVKSVVPLYTPLPSTGPVIVYFCPTTKLPAVTASEKLFLSSIVIGPVEPAVISIA